MQTRRPGEPSPLYIGYVLTLLMVACMFSMLDRLVLSLVVDPIRKDLSLSETEISLMLGLAFSIFYTVLGIPFGRYVDTRGRRNLIAVGIVLWSFATIACGLARNFWSLFLARMTVGVGEATINPASYSMIADLVPVHRRGIAMGAYSMGSPIGGGLALLLGGLLLEWAIANRPVLPFLGEIAPWQFVFLVAGAPGILLGLIIWLTVREPVRKLTPGMSDVVPTIPEVVAYLREHRRMFALVMLGFAGFVTNSYAYLTWGPTYFMRVHGMGPAQAGVLFGIAFGVGSAAAVLVGGMISDFMVKRGHPHAAVKVGLWSALLPIPIFLIAYLSSNTMLAAVMIILGVFLASFYGALQGVAMQTLTPNRMRGQVAALYLTLVNLIGLGVTPTVTALLTEHVFGGDMGIGKALAVTSTVSLLWAALLLFFSLKSVRVRALALSGT